MYWVRSLKFRRGLASGYPFKTGGSSPATGLMFKFGAGAFSVLSGLRWSATQRG
ncbi:hypothetical protein DR91_2055 [Neisseria lactamica ATCC 23970]|nr:hypothetical protein DR91_2055 [Neisseria lactamica ATCC 23970]